MPQKSFIKDLKKEKEIITNSHKDGKLSLTSGTSHYGVSVTTIDI